MSNLRVIEPRKPEPDASCVSLLKAALQRAEAGEFDECIVVLVNGHDGASEWETTGFSDATIATAIGELFIVQHYLSDVALHDDE